MTRSTYPLLSALSLALFGLSTPVMAADFDSRTAMEAPDDVLRGDAPSAQGGKKKKHSHKKNAKGKGKHKGHAHAKGRKGSGKKPHVKGKKPHVKGKKPHVKGRNEQGVGKASGPMRNHQNARPGPRADPKQRAPVAGPMQGRPHTVRAQNQQPAGGIGRRPAGQGPGRAPIGKAPSTGRPGQGPIGKAPSAERPGQGPIGKRPGRVPEGKKPVGERPGRVPVGKKPVGERPGRVPVGKRPGRGPEGRKPVGERPGRGPRAGAPRQQAAAVHRPPPPPPSYNRAGKLSLGVTGGVFVDDASLTANSPDIGLGLSARLRAIEALGFEFAWARHAQDWEGNSTSYNSPMQASAQLFLAPGSMVTPYVTGGYTWLRRDIDGVSDRVSGPHGGLGVEIALGDRVAVGVDARYIHLPQAMPVASELPGAVQVNTGLSFYF